MIVPDIICSKCKEKNPECGFPIRDKSGKPRKECENCYSAIRSYQYENRKRKKKIEIKEKLCIECEKTRDIEEFRKHPSHPDGRDIKCKYCMSEYYQSDNIRQYLKKKKESGKQKEILDRYRESHKQEISERKKAKRRNNLLEIRQKDRQQKRNNTKLAHEILGGKCSKCGEQSPGKLAIDHINDDGANERKLIRFDRLTSLIRQGKVDTNRYQLLCHNHNFERYLQNLRTKPYRVGGVEKECTSCHEPRTHEEFVRDKYKSAGVKSICRACQNTETKMRKRMIVDLFNGKCNKCGENNIDYLCVDHINDDGSKKRKNGEHLSIYTKLKLGMSKEGLQVLCLNCNGEKEYYRRLNVISDV